MRAIVFTIFSTFIWLMSMTQGTGLGDLYDTTGKTRAILIIIAICIVINKVKTIKIKKINLFIYAIFIFSFVIYPYYVNDSDHGLQYMYVFLMIFIVSQYSLDSMSIKLTSLAYGTLGIVFLSFYNFTDILSGWNTNSVAMLGFFSYISFYYGFMNVKSRKERYIVLGVLYIYMILLEIANSRGSVLFTLLTLVFIFKIVKAEKFLKYKIVTIFALLIPLIIALAVINISKMPLFIDLNNWSIETFSKPIFNGRDTLWESGLDTFEKYPFLGSGSLSFNAHNSAILCLFGFGLVGYISWLAAFQSIIDKAVPYLNDTFVCQGITGFLVIYLQQSIELGFLHMEPSFIPYMTLGIVLGRIKYLREAGFNAEA